MGKLILNKLDFNSIDSLSIPVGSTVLGIDSSNNKLSKLDYAGETTIVEQMGNFYTTAATYSDGFIYFNRNDQEDAYVADLTALLGSINTYTTGFTYDNINTLTISDNSGNTFSVSITQFSGLTVNGELITDIITVDQINADTIVADIFSGGTYYGDGSNLQGVATSTDYKFAKLPSQSVTPQYPTDSGAWEYFYQNQDDWKLLPPNYPFIFLNNGHLANIDYCISVLPDGTLIYEAFDYDAQASGETNTGYFIAMKPNDLDPTLLEKVGEAPWTTQFNEVGWNYTFKDPLEPNAVQFINYKFGFNDDSAFISHITKVEISGSTILTTDIVYDFSGLTVGDIFFNLTGEIKPDFQYFALPETILDDDYNGMAYGPYSGWFYMRAMRFLPNSASYILALNMLTGDVKLIDALASFSNVTNFNPAIGFDDKSIGFNYISHPTGLIFYGLNNQNLVDNYSLSGVTAIWSPDWVNNTEVRYLDTRDPWQGQYTNTDGEINNGSTHLPREWYYDNEYFHFFLTPDPKGNTFMWSRIKIDSQDPTENLIIPITKEDLGQNNTIGDTTYSTWYSNTGMLMYINPGGSDSNSFSNYRYFYWNVDQEKPYRLQSNNAYPTHVIGNKTYSISNGLQNNTISLGFEYDQYDDITF